MAEGGGGGGGGGGGVGGGGGASGVLKRLWMRKTRKGSRKDFASKCKLVTLLRKGRQILGYFFPGEERRGAK